MQTLAAGLNTEARPVNLSLSPSPGQLSLYCTRSGQLFALCFSWEGNPSALGLQFHLMWVFMAHHDFAVLVVFVPLPLQGSCEWW